MKMSRKVNKRIITVFAFTIFIIGLVFVFQKDDQFRINSSAKKSDPLENYGPEVIGGSIKETGGTENKKSKSKFVIVDSYGVNGGEKEHGLSKSIDMAVEASEIFFGLEKKEALYFIGKIVEFFPVREKAHDPEDGEKHPDYPVPQRCFQGVVL